MTKKNKNKIVEFHEILKSHDLEHDEMKLGFGNQFFFINKSKNKISCIHF